MRSLILLDLRYRGFALVGDALAEVQRRLPGMILWARQREWLASRLYVEEADKRTTKTFWER